MWALTRKDDSVAIQVEAAQFDVHSDFVWVPCQSSTKSGDVLANGAWSTPGEDAPTLMSRRAELATERYNRETSGVLFKAASASAATLIATDAISQSKLVAAFAAAANNLWVDGTPWKTSDGSFMPMVADDIHKLAAFALNYVSACYMQESKLFADLATNLDTDITQGWPSNVA